jgi:hypothetical protein
VILVVVGVHRRRDGGVAQLLGERRVVAQFLVVEIEIDGVEPEAVDPPVQPEAHHVEQGFLNFRIVEVQIRLRGEEIVQVILLAVAVPLPGGAAEDRQPVVGRRAIGLGVGPDIPVGLGVGRGPSGFR